MGTVYHDECFIWLIVTKPKYCTCTACSERWLITVHDRGGEIDFICVLESKEACGCTSHVR